MFILGYNFRQRRSVNNGFVVWKHISYGKLAYRNTINEVKIRNTTTTTTATNVYICQCNS